MKVIKPGDGWTISVQCTKKSGGCGAVLEIAEADLSVGCAAGYDYLGDANGEEACGVRCPQCARFWILEKKLVPKTIAGRVFERRPRR